jgi:hypothetical protein
MGVRVLQSPALALGAGRAQVFQVFVLVGVDFFALQSFDEAFAARIVVWIRRAAHARHDPVLP